jgi:hypothetical protein
MVLTHLSLDPLPLKSAVLLRWRRRDGLDEAGDAVLASVDRYWLLHVV